MLNQVDSERYSRQVILKDFGAGGQQKLLQAKVLVIGAGGLGCPVLQYLAAAGVGTIGLVDDDVVNLSNLHRQVLFNTEDIGSNKATAAANKLNLLNEGVITQVFNYRLHNKNAWHIISNFDLVIDGSDNFATRYLVNDICSLLAKPLVYGSVFRFEGQVAVFNHQNKISYRDVYPVQPGAGQVPDCSEAGVLGVLPGIIGSLMANEAIKIISGLGSVLDGELLTYNSLSNTFYQMEVVPAQQHNGPASREAVEDWAYEDQCSTSNNFGVIEPEQFGLYIQQPETVIVDVRETGELPAIDTFEHSNIPLSSLKNSVPNFTQKTIVVFCQSGVRSVQAAGLIASNASPHQQVLMLKNGILSWINSQPATNSQPTKSGTYL